MTCMGYFGPIPSAAVTMRMRFRAASGGRDAKHGRVTGKLRPACGLHTMRGRGPRPWAWGG